MMRKTFIASFVLAAVDLIQPNVASARGGWWPWRRFWRWWLSWRLRWRWGFAEEGFADVSFDDLALGPITVDTITANTILTRTAITTRTAAAT
jgi:hypothetical protein